MKLASPIVMAYPGPPRRAGGIARYLIVGILLCSVLFYYRHEAQTAALNSHYLDSYLDSTHPHDSPQNPHVPTVPGPKDPLAGKGQQIEKQAEKPIEQSEDVATHPPPQAAKPVEPAPKPVEPVTNPKPSIHPIDTLIKGAENTFQELLKKESHDLESAAAEYRRRRGRHPPPGFDKWFEFAQKHNAVMVEDFFDQIYHDLTPYWGLPASTLRKESWDYDMVINIRNGNSSTTSNWFWTQIWLNMTQTIQHLLPDMDLPLNAMDEPRILVPWEEVNQYMEKEKETRKMPPAHQVISEFHRLDAPGEGNKDKDVQTREKDWEEVYPFWKIVTRGCPPDSLARKAEVATDFSKTPAISLAHTTLHSYKGYVSNFSLAIDPCHQPDLQNLHGMMINPLSVRSTKVLAPMFGGSKLPMNNEILLPAPMYWTDEERFSGGNDHGEGWGTKKDKVVWRGVATGGRNKAENWRGFQRHRFVAMTNGTQVSGAESWQMIPENWALPSSQYDLAAQQDGKLGKWVGEWSDTGFVDLMCHGPQPPNTTCSYTGSYFSIAKGMKMGDQFDRKYLPDIDGNSFSGRYRGFLMSTSLPIKATIFKEWHDSRLIAWKHFVPMDNRFMDFYGIMQYFLGYKSESITIPSHDSEAERIALAGQEWANRVLRKEDMQIYTLRLLLEFARLSDDRREMMGWVQDLL